MRFLIAAAALCAAGPAFGHGLWWQKPTAWDDGSPITEPISTLVEWSDGDTFGEVHGTRLVATASSATMPDPTSTRCYRVRAIAAGETSDPSNVWCKVVGQAPPPPPARKLPNAPTGLGGD
jgi:hypothetical protein